MLKIGIFGTFDVQNYGDLLFPLIAEYELQKRLGQVQIQPFSYHSKSAANWYYPVTSLEDLPTQMSLLDGVLIGGGHIIRFDKGIAPGYLPPSTQIHHPTGYWLAPILIALQYGIPVAWNSPGVYGEIPHWARLLFSLALEQSHYVSVRDEWAKELLQTFSMQSGSQINVRPDSAFGIASVFPHSQPSSEYLRLLESLNLTRPYLVVQATNNLEQFGYLVQKNPDFFNQYHIIALPTAPVCGDDTYYLEKCIPSFLTILEWPNPALMTEIICGSQAVIGVSLHLSITALAYGIPVFRPILENRKFSLLAQFDTVYFFDTNESISLEWFKSRVGQSATGIRVKNMLQQLNLHWDHIAKTFSKDTRQTNALTALSKAWQVLPNIMESMYQKKDLI